MSAQSSHTTIDRRGFLVLATVAGTALAAGQLVPSSAPAARGDAARLIKDLTGGTQPKSGRIRLKLPEVAEYGDTVPLTIEVESPMTDADYVEAVYIFAEEHPLAHVVTFNFTPTHVSGNSTPILVLPLIHG